MTEEFKQLREDSPGSSRSSAEANIHDPTGKVLAIVSFGLSCLAVGAALVACWLLPKLMEANAETTKVALQAKLDAISDAATRAENHARNAETKVGILEEARNADRSKPK